MEMGYAIQFCFELSTVMVLAGFAAATKLSIGEKRAISSFVQVILMFRKFFRSSVELRQSALQRFEGAQMSR